MRFNERSFVVLVAGVLAGATAIAIAAFLVLGGDDDEPGGSAAAANAASSLTGGPDEFLYLSGSSLVRRDVEAGTEDPVDQLPTPSVYAAPGSHWIAYVTSEKVDEGDFAAEPVLHLYDVEEDEKSKHGPGVAPVWNHSGTHVAFLRPVEPRECRGETCSGDTQIAVVEAATGEEDVFLDPGQYSILGWAGDLVLVSDFRNPSRVTTVSLDGDDGVLDMPPSQYWDASPDGRWVVKTNAKKTEFVPIQDGELGDDRVTIELGDHELLEGAWSHDSTRVAAVTRLASKVEKGKGKKKKLVPQDPTTQIVTFSPDDPEPAIVEETYGATGSVFWSVDNESIVFASLLDPKKGLFQAKHCPAGNEGECSIVTSWTEGIALLRTE